MDARARPAPERPERRRGARPADEAIRRELSARGIEVLDTLELVAVRGPEDERLFDPPPLGRWSPAGHRRVAEAIAERLTALAWLR